MNENQIADIWMLFKEYIDKKTLELAAERYIDLLADNVIIDKAIVNSSGFEEVLDSAIEYYLDEEDVEEDSDEEDNWDFDNDD